MAELKGQPAFAANVPATKVVVASPPRPRANKQPEHAKASDAANHRSNQDSKPTNNLQTNQKPVENQ